MVSQDKNFTGQATFKVQRFKVQGSPINRDLHYVPTGGAGTDSKKFFSFGL
jgi:hypothetical protein